MKKLFIILCLCFIASISFADFVIVGSDSKGIAKVKKKPKNVTGMERRGETAHNVPGNIKDVPAEDLLLEDGSIVEREYTQQEQNLKKYNEEYEAEEQDITKHVKNTHIDEMIANGEKFKYDHYIK